MATSKAMKIVRGLAGKNVTIFNDRLKSGKYSIKVWGWGKQDYAVAKAALEAAGLQVEMVTFTKFSYRMAEEYIQTRLHVVA